MATPTQENVEPQPQKAKLFQNSYRMESKNSFNPVKVKLKILNIFDVNLQELELTEQCLPDLCADLTEEIKTAVKEEKYDRYRIIVTVYCGQKKMQGIKICHSFLWDHERDKFVECIFENNNFFVQAVVYGVYLE